MLETLLERFLNRLFGHYLHIDRNQASVGLRSGDMKLRNVAMKSTLTELLAFPARLLSGKIGGLRVAFEWRRLGSTPLVLEVENVEAVLEDIPESAWKESGIFSKIVSTRKQVVDAVDLQCEFALSSEAKGSGILGFLGGRMLRMVEVRVKNVHVKVIRDAEFCVGVTLNALTLTNAGGSMGSFTTSLDKKILLNDLAVYLNPDLAKQEPLMFILEPVTGELDLKSCAIPTGRSYAATGVVRDVSVALSKAQYTQLVALVNFIHNYNIYTLKYKTKLRLYDVYKPVVRPSETASPGSVRKWWRWAVYCVRENLSRSRSSAASSGDELSPTERPEERMTMMNLVSDRTLRRLGIRAEYQRLCRAGFNNASLSPDDSARRKFLEACLDLDDLVRWRSEVVLEHLIQEAKETANKPPSGWSAWIWGTQPAAKNGPSETTSAAIDPNSIDLPKRNSLVTVDLKLLKASLQLVHTTEEEMHSDILANDYAGPAHVIDGALEQVNVSVLYDGSDPLTLPEIKAGFILQDAKLRSTKNEKQLEIIKRSMPTPVSDTVSNRNPLARIELVSGVINSIEVQTEKMSFFYDQQLVDDLLDFFKSTESSAVSLLPDLSAAKQNLHEFYLSDKRPKFRMNFRAKVPEILLPLRPRSLRNAVVLNLGALAIDSIDQSDPTIAEYSVALTGACLSCGHESVLQPVDVNMTATLRKSPSEVKLFGRFLGSVDLALSPSSYSGVIRALRLLNKPEVKTVGAAVVKEAADALNLTAVFEGERLRCSVDCFDARIPGLPQYKVELELASLKTEAAVNSASVKVVVNCENFIYRKHGESSNLMRSLTPPKIILTIKPYVELHFALEHLLWRFQPESIRFLLGFLKNNLPDAPSDVRPVRVLSNPATDRVDWTLRFTWSSVDVVWLKEEVVVGEAAGCLGTSKVGTSECAINFYDSETYRVTAGISTVTLSTGPADDGGRTLFELTSANGEADVPLRLNVHNVTLCDHEMTDIAVNVRSPKMTLYRADLEDFAKYLFGSFLPAVSGDVPFAVSDHLRAEAHDAEMTGFVSAGESDEEAKEIGEAVEVVRRKLQRLKYEQDLVKKAQITVLVEDAVLTVPSVFSECVSLISMNIRRIAVRQKLDTYFVDLDLSELNIGNVRALCSDSVLVSAAIERGSTGNMSVEVKNLHGISAQLSRVQYGALQEAVASLSKVEAQSHVASLMNAESQTFKFCAGFTDLSLGLVDVAGDTFAKFSLGAVNVNLTKEISDVLFSCSLVELKWVSSDVGLAPRLELTTSLDITAEARAGGEANLVIRNSGMRCVFVMGEIVNVASVFSAPSPMRSANPSVKKAGARTNFNVDLKDACILFPCGDSGTTLSLIVGSLQTVGELSSAGDLACVKANIQGGRVQVEGASGKPRTLVSRLDVFASKTENSVKINIEPVVAKIRRGVDTSTVGDCVAWQRHRLAECIRVDSGVSKAGVGADEYGVWDYEVLQHGGTIEVHSTRGERWLQIGVSDCQVEGSGLVEQTKQRESHVCRGQVEVNFLGRGGKWEPVVEVVAFKLRKMVSGEIVQWFFEVPEESRGILLTVSEELLQSINGAGEGVVAEDTEEDLDTVMMQQQVFVKNETGGSIMVHGPAESLVTCAGERVRIKYEGESIAKNCRVAVSGEAWFVARVPVDRDAVESIEEVGIFEGEAKKAVISVVSETPGSSALTLTLWSQVSVENAFINTSIRVHQGQVTRTVAAGNRAGVKDDEIAWLEVAEGKEVRRVRLNIRSIKDQVVKEGRNVFQLEAEKSADFRDFFLCVSVQVQIKKYRDLYTKLYILHIRPPITVRSALPCVVGFLIGPTTTVEGSDTEQQRAVAGELKLDEQRQVCRLGLSEPLGIRICVFGSIWSSTTAIWPCEDGERASLIVQDTLGCRLRIFVEQQSRRGQPLEFLLSVNSWLCVSRDISDFLEFSNDHGLIARAGLQAAVAVPLHVDTTSLQVRLAAAGGGGDRGRRMSSGMATAWSEVFPIETLGYSAVVGVTRGGVMDLSVRVTGRLDDGGSSLKGVRYVVIRAKYVMINRLTSGALELAETSSRSGSTLVVQAGEEKIFGFWREALNQSGASVRRLRLRVVDEGWQWSGEFDVSDAAAIEGDQVLQVFNEAALYFLNIRIQVRIENGVNYVIFSRPDGRGSDWVVRNATRHVLWVRQADTAISEGAHFIPVPAAGEVPFAWFEPTKPKIIEVLLDRTKAVLGRLPDLVNGTAGVLAGELPFLVALDGACTVLTLGAVSASGLGPAAKLRADLAVRVELPRLELSLVLTSHGDFQSRREVVMVSVVELVAQLAQAKETWEFRFKIGNFQVDDMREEAAFPVVLSSTAAAEGSVVFEWPTISSDPLIVRRGFLGLGKMRLNVDYGLVSEFSDFLRRISKSGATEAAPTNTTTRGSRMEVLFNELAVGTVRLDLSFSPGSGRVHLAMMSTSLVDRLLAGIAGFENCGVVLKALVMKKARASESGVANVLVEHYKHELYKCMRAILGSSEVLGNPIGLYDNITSGLQDLIAEPLNALISIEGRPAEDLLNIADSTARGAKSFASKTTYGVFNSIGNLANSGANTLAMLASDKNFYQDRTDFKRKNKPVHLGQGLAAGAAALGSGLLSGISGLVTKPVEGLQKRGFQGLATGAVKGVGGLFLKPLTGILDLAGSVAGGVAGEVAMAGLSVSDQARQGEVISRRVRHARMMYGQNHNIRVLNEDHGVLNELISSAGIAGISSLQNFVDFVFDGVSTLLVVSTGDLVVVDLAQKLLVLRVSLWRIVEVAATSEGSGRLEIMVVPRSASDADSFVVSFASGESAVTAKVILENELAASR